MDFVKRLLGIETDTEWFAGQPLGLGSEKYTNWDPFTSILLGRRCYGYCAEYSEATVEEIWKTKNGNLVYTQRYKDDRDASAGQISNHQAYSFLQSYVLTPEGHSFMQELRQSTPEL